MASELGELQVLLEKHEIKGIYTIMRDDILICASQKFTKNVIHRNSFWVSYEDRRWYISTWTPKLYILPESCDVNDVLRICELLLKANHTIVQIPSEILKKYKIELIE